MPEPRLLQKVLTIAGGVSSRTFDSSEYANLIILGGANCATAGRYNTLRKVNGSAGAGYQVTALKTLTVHAAVLGVSSATPTPSGIFFYADNDSGYNSASTPTNAVYLFGDSTSTIGVGNMAGEGRSVVILQWQVPAGKYLGFIPTVANMSVISYCLEA